VTHRLQPIDYRPTSDAARAWGVRPEVVRARCARGEVPGATRVGAHGTPWVIPADTIRALTLEVPDSPAALERENGATLERVTPDPTPSTTTRGDSGDSLYATPAPIVASARRVVARLATVRSRPVTALEALAWELSLIGTDPDTPPHLAAALARLLEQTAATVDPLGADR
jgi:hypothetical protein